MATDLISSRLVVRHAAKALDDGSPIAVPLASMAKLQATDKCFNVCPIFFEIYNSGRFFCFYQGSDL